MLPLKRKRVYYGWFIALFGSLLIFFIAGTSFYGIAIYLVPLQKALNTTRGRISQAFAIISLLSGLMMPLVGSAVDKWGAKKCLSFGFTGLAITFFLFSRMANVAHLYILVIFQGIFQSFSGGLPNQALIGKWFIKRRGRAMGLVSAGIGLGGLVMPWVLGNIIENSGFRTAYLFTSLLIAGFCLPITLFFIKDSPFPLGLRPDGLTQKQESQIKKKKQGLYLRHARKLYPFWAILAATALSQGIVGLVSMHLPAMLQDSGLEISQAAGYFGIMLGIGISGRLLVGELSDRFKPRYLFIITGLGMALCVSLLFLLHVPIVRSIFVVLYGIFQGASATLIPLMVHSLFGGRVFGRVYGALLLASAASVAVGNYIGGFIFDRTSNYRAAISIAVIMGLVSAFFAMTARIKGENSYR